MKNILIGGMLGVVLATVGTVALDMVHAKPSVERVVNADKIECKSITVREFTLKDDDGNARVFITSEKGSRGRTLLFVRGPGDGQPQLHVEVDPGYAAICLGNPEHGSPLAFVVDNNGKAWMQRVEGKGSYNMLFPDIDIKTINRVLKATKKVEKTIHEDEIGDVFESWRNSHHTPSDEEEWTEEDEKRTATFGQG